LFAGKKMNKTLTKELTRIIFGSIGFVPRPNFGKVGISTEEYLTSNEIQVQLDNNTSEIYSVWAGEAKQDNSKLIIAATSIIEDNYCEFNAVYKIDSGYIHAIKSSYYDEDEIPNLFIYKIDGKWKQLGVYNQLLAAAGFIRMADLGIEYTPVKEINYELDLALKELIER